MKIDYSKLEDLIYQAFCAVSMEESNARTMARVLTAAEARGVYSHGVQLVPVYIRLLRAGKLNANPRCTVLREAPGAILMDGDNGLGGLCMREAMNLAVQHAKTYGSVTLCMRNGTHYGAGAYYAQALADAGMVSYLYATANAMAVPFGGAQRYFGTNPYTFGAPAGRFGALILDMATTEVAYGKVAAALNEGRQIPASWGVAADGRHTTDPNAIQQGGALCHFGGAKGYGIAFMIDVAAAVLSGAPYLGKDIFVLPTDTHLAAVGFFLQVIDPSFFVGKEAFLQRMEALIDDVKASRKAEGVQEIFFPGEIENRSYAKAVCEGVQVHDAAYAAFADTLASLGIRTEA